MYLERLREDIKKYTDLDKDTLSEARIAIMKEDLQDLYNQSKMLHLDLIAKKPSATAADSVSDYFNNKVMEDIREQYFTYWPMLDETFKKPIKNEAESFNQSLIEGLTSGFRGDFKLPDLKIPKFSGNYRDWKRFYGLFMSNVHEDTRYSAVQKLSYFRII